MDKTSIEEADEVLDSATVCKPLTDDLDASNLSLNYYELAPGDSFAYGYHSHETQEEVFLVLDGTATFETDKGDVEVGKGEVACFHPGEFQRGVNRSDQRLRAFAFGAPREMGETTVMNDCSNCGKRTGNRIKPHPDREAMVTCCEECGSITEEFD
ncbi:MAG: cupin domain-containing protein [Halobacteria archaeon]